ncbi:uncharacterized protein LOC123939116 isoform X2 [Meles meles]|uniref:uncharacterized protein LOC123939116 isoform X2 n=1 Tax=Meles meles TaxID=9662 RepID=UPI001E69A5E7|nr:uncharacterized protein LOC123939116 isoform X2 [Meles meles]
MEASPKCKYRHVEESLGSSVLSLYLPIIHSATTNTLPASVKSAGHHDNQRKAFNSGAPTLLRAEAPPLIRSWFAGAEGISGLVVQPVELVIPAGPVAASRSRAAAAFGCGDKCKAAAELVWEGCFAARGGVLYFHIGETEKKCFIEEIPDETMVIGNYRTQLYDKQREEYQPATPGLGMFVEVKDPEDKHHFSALVRVCIRLGPRTG